MFSFMRSIEGSLRLKIIIWSFLPTAITLVAVGLVSFYAFQHTTRLLLIERNREVVRLMAVQLAGEMEEYSDILADLAHSATISGRNPEEWPVVLSQYSNFLVVFEGGVVITDEHGMVVAAEPERPEILGQDWSGRAYFRELLRSREAVWSAVVSDGPAGEQVIVVAAPVYSGDGGFQGMAAGMFHLGATRVSAFYGDIVKLRIGASDYAHLNTYLVDQYGQVIYHTNSAYMGDDFEQQEPVSHITSGNISDQFSLQSRGRPDFLGNAGALRTNDVEGRQVVAYYAKVPGTGWGLVSEASWVGLLSYYRIYLTIQSFLFVLGVVLPALIVAYGIRQITEPIFRLKTAAKEVAQGHFGAEIHVKTGDELEELVDQFNQMSMQLSQSYTAIQEREQRLALVMQGTNDGIWDWNLQSGRVYYSPRWKEMLGYTDQEIGDQLEDWRRLVHPDDLENVVAAIESHLSGLEPLFHLEHRLLHKDGNYHWLLARAVTVRGEAGEPLRIVGSHSDITERKLAEDALRRAYETLEERVGERTRELATLNAITSLVSRSLDLNEILSDALDKTLEVMDLDIGAAYRLEGDQENVWLPPEQVSRASAGHLFLNPLVYRGYSRQFIRSIGRIPCSESCFDGDTSLEQPLVRKVLASAVSVEEAALSEAGIAQLVSIPLKAKGKLIGMIKLGARAERNFSAEELHLLQAIGQQVGVAVENARLHEAVQQTATLEERSRLARELHDSVTQSMYSVTLLAEAAARLLLAGDHVTAAGHLRELRDTAQESLREMRLLIFELRPVALEKDGLAGALRTRLEAVEARSGIKTDLVVEGTETLPFAVKSELYHIAQEALNNVLKHAHASRVQIHLRFSDLLTCLEVSDDGAGFDPDRASSCGGLGLAGITERVQKIGGRLQIESAQSRGTRVRVALEGEFGEGRKSG